MESIKSLLSKAKPGQEVAVHGWVKSKRVSKKFAFIVVNDGSQQADLQVIVDADTPAHAQLEEVATGSAVGVRGVWQESPGKGQAWELVAAELSVFGGADPESYPLQKKGHSLEFLREIGHLRARTNTFGAVLRVRNRLSQLVHQFFQERDFLWVHTPILTASDCEGAGELFQVSTLDLARPPMQKGQVDYSQDFFGRRSYLTVSGQLEAESLALAMSKVYTFGPTFRAENSNTSRHLAEFWMIEPEVAFADLQDMVNLSWEFMSFLLREIVKACPEELAFFAKRYEARPAEQLLAVAEAKLTQMSYTDAVKELQSAKQGFEYPVSWGVDLQSEHERYLTDVVCQGPVAVTDYPAEIKAFYMRMNDDNKTVAALDVLVPRIGEIIGGSQREERLEVLERRLAEAGVPRADLDWYLDLRRFGSAPHAGFGLGFERLIQYVTGMANIRDTVPFPRTPGSIAF